MGIGSGDEKVIKIGAKADETGFKAVERHVRSVRQEVERLNGELNKMGRGLFGQTNQSAIKMPTAQQATTPVATLSKQLLDSKQLFETISRGSTTALKSMTAALRTESSAQSQLVSRLRKEVEQLSNTYAHLEDARNKGITLADPLAPVKTRRQMFTAASQLAQAEELQSIMYRREQQLIASGGAPGGQGKWGARMGLMKEDAMGMAGSWASRLGIGQNIMQYGGAAVIGAVIGKTLVNSMKSGMQEAGQAPWDFLQRGSLQSGWGREALNIKGGDLTILGAYRMAQNNAETKKAFSDLARGDSNSLMPSGFERSASGGFSFNAEGYKRLQAGAKGFWGTMKLDPLGGINQGLRDINAAPSQMTGDQIKFLQAIRDTFPLHFEAQRQFQQNSAGDVGAMRALNMGTDRYRSLASAQQIPGGVKFNLAIDSDGNIIPGEKANSALRLLRKYEDRGISRGEVIGAMQGIEGIAGLGAGQRYLNQGVSGAIGHLPGATQIAGMGALVGSRGFFPAVSGLVGRGSGGMEVSAAGVLGGTVANTLASGAAPTSGLGLLGAASAFSRGRTGAEDMLNARFMQNGIGAMGNMLGGRTDAYQQGVNILSAIRALPSGSVGAQEYLARIEPRVLFDVAGGGEVPLELQARGITSEAVKKYADLVMARSRDRAISVTPNQGGKINAVQTQTQAINEQYGGSFQKYMADQLGYFDNQKDKDLFAKTAITQRGAYLTEVGLAGSDLEGQAFARLEAGLGKYGTGNVKGRGLSDAAGGADELQHMRMQSQFQGELERKREQMSPALQADMAMAKPAVQMMTDAAHNIGGSAKELGMALDELTNKIREFSKRINVNAAPPVRAGAPRP